MQTEMEELIEGICSAYKDFSQKQAEIASHLEVIASEDIQRSVSQAQPLPELSEGPDEVLFFPDPSATSLFGCKHESSARNIGACSSPYIQGIGIASIFLIGNGPVEKGACDMQRGTIANTPKPDLNSFRLCQQPFA